LPPDATVRQSVNGYVTPIPEDLSGPEILNLSVTTAETTATIHRRTSEPASSQLEWSGGGISIEPYANLTHADVTLKTEHEVTLTGLQPDKDYQFLMRVFDATAT
jgi:hypothetical protein